MASRIGAALSSKLSNYRRLHGLTFDQLAARSGVSKGMLVQIEQKKANPSIGVLCRIAAALSISMVDLVAGPDPGQDARKGILEPGPGVRLWSSPAGGFAVLETGTRGAAMFELWSWRLMPGDVFHAPAHGRGTTELIKVDRGTLSITVGAEVTHVKRGQSLTFLSDQAHSYACLGSRPTVFTMAVWEPRAS